MKILINVTGVKFGGSFTDFYNILKELVGTGRNHRYYIFVSKEARAKIPPLPHNFNVFVFPLAERSWPVHFMFDQAFLPIFALLNKIDVIISFNFSSFFAPCRQIVRVTQPVCFSPIVSEKMKFQGIRYVYKMLIYRYLILFSVKKADKVIFISEALRQDVGRFIKLDAGSNKYSVSYNGIDAGFVESGQTDNNLVNMFLPDNAFKILFPSFYYFHKNFPVLFEAAVELRKMNVLNVKFVLTIKPEDMPQKEMEKAAKIIKDFNLSQDIIFMGSVPYPKMPRLYKSVDAVVFPSFAEACPNPLPEAMAFGVPIVASDIPVHRELCQDAAIYFNVYNAKDLAEKIILLSGNEHLRKQLAANGIERSKAFSWQEHVRRIYELTEELKR